MPPLHNPGAGICNVGHESRRGYKTALHEIGPELRVRQAGVEVVVHRIGVAHYFVHPPIFGVCR
jgi:hypothetical protein